MIFVTSIKDPAAGFRFSGGNDSNTSSLTILGNTLKSNRTYQFMVNMTNRRNASLQAAGYMLVEMKDNQPQLIVTA